MKVKIKKKPIIMATIGILAVGAIAGYIFWSRQATAEEYMTGKIERGTIRNTVAATGTLQAVTTVQVGSQVSGTISALYVDFNSNVKRGQLVAQLDPAIFQAQVASARANLEQSRANLADAQARLIAARSTIDNQRAGVSSANANLAALKAQRDDAQNQLKRQEELAKAGIIAERELETARTNYASADARYNQAAAQVEQARVTEKSSAGAGIAQADAGVKQAQAQVQQTQASLQLAEVNLSHTTIRSPIDGVVVSRNVDVGQTVAASLSAPTLFTIANDLTQMQVIANIDQADIGVINQSNRVSFTVDAFPGQNFNGEISQIRLNPQNVQNVITYNVVINVSNPDLKLKPGMTSNLTMTIAERTDVLKVPNAALRFRPADMTPEKMRELMRGSFGNRGGRGPEGQGQGQGQNAAQGQGQSPQPALSPQAGQSPQPTPGQASRQPGKGQGNAPGGQPAAGGAGNRPADGEARPEGGRGRGGIAAATSPVMEGQIRFVWVLGPDNKPVPHRIKVGITDGTATEMVEGDLKEGDPIIIGQNISAENRTQGGQRAPGFGGGPGGGGFGGGRPGGAGGGGGGVRR
jgi:HlyD family secretion protein